VIRASRAQAYALFAAFFLAHMLTAQPCWSVRHPHQRLPHGLQAFDFVSTIPVSNTAKALCSYCA
jgi:hypothetical protein